MRTPGRDSDRSHPPRRRAGVGRMAYRTTVVTTVASIIVLGPIRVDGSTDSSDTDSSGSDAQLVSTR
ncbi:hypothetical protein [Nocardioides bruguierae]|uniref:hypothetical protein n=1 Tax=Nocardioides bruguierae TaxID=2945102 RepID=UPI00202132F0|nr:hypothetical protein [Nocardioides bruguierae]MCL8026672.1 hypothetical protein [Nocardioides bruguierae]